MKIEIKQNPYTAAWYVRAACPVAGLVLRSDPAANLMTNEGIAAIAGREWFRRYMSGELGIGPDWHALDVPSLGAYYDRTLEAYRAAYPEAYAAIVASAKQEPAHV